MRPGKARAPLSQLVPRCRCSTVPGCAKLRAEEEAAHGAFKATQKMTSSRALAGCMRPTLVAGVTALLLAGPALAQAQQPQVSAAELQTAAPPLNPPNVDHAVEAFVDGCVAHDGDRQAVVDWAVNNGYQPVDTLQSDAQAQYLGGRSGTVMHHPNDVQIVLVATEGEQCMVWAENASGPKLNFAFQKALGNLARSGAQAKTTVQRMVSRGGIWRRQLQVRFKRAEGSREFGLGAVTMVNRTPGTQALKFAPWSEAAPASQGDSASAR